MKVVYGLGYTFFKAGAHLLFSYRVVGREHLIEDGPALVASNHASFLDPPMVGIAFKEPIYFLARKTLFRGPFGWLFRRWNAVPVDQERADFTSLKTIIKLLRGGERVLIFPEGERTRDGNLLGGKPGVGLVIAKAGVPVLPVRLFGTREALPRDARFPRRTPITLVVGEPIVFSQEELKGGGKAGYADLSRRVMEAITALKLP
ncbi:lysophospholipid acyltransferase family protein [soil metagenome]